MSLTKLGQGTKTIWLKGPEAHKLHNEFEVAAGATVKVSQPVILDTDGLVKPAPAGTAKNLIIGYSIHNGKEKELVTVVMVGFTMIYAKPDATITAGPVKNGLMNANDDSYLSVSNTVNAADQFGWAIDAGDADDKVRVVLF